MTSRRRPAAATRVLLTGVSAAATLGMVAVMSAARGPDTAVAAHEAQPLRVLITDRRIDPDVAAAAALRGARRGQAIVRVPVAGAPQPATPASSGGSGGAHTTTRSS